MAKTALKHGAVIETVTAAEVSELLSKALARENAKRVRVSANLKLDANGNGTEDVYVVPVGFELEVRRVFIDLDSAADPGTGNVPLNVAGKSVEYLRSDSRIEYGAPSGPNAIPQVPGVQTWGAEQGPYYRNAEVFQVRVKGLTPNQNLQVQMEGILKRPEADPNRR